MIWLPFVTAVLSAAVCTGQDLVGCGGFIRATVPLPYDRIEMKLVTLSGLVKYKTECAPSNGYFLIPLYDKGEYVLKVEGPDGWSFEPSEVQLSVDGVSDRCSKGEDINFAFTGFTVRGQVLSNGLSVGPEGVTLLLSNTVSGATKEMTSGTQGYYSFREVLPADYVVTASHPLWTVSSSTVAITVDKDSVTVSSDSLLVLGYDMKGRVMTDEVAVSGVKFFLYASEGQKVECDTVAAVDGVTTPDCAVVSDDEGDFVFSSIPPGEYTIVPHYLQQGIVFEVVPEQASLTVRNDSVVVKPVFEVQGFSVNGQVLISKQGQGIPGAKIYMNGDMKATTDSDGHFLLYNMTTGLYLFQVEASEVMFEPVEIKVSPSTPKIPPFIPSRYSVCGEMIISALPAGLSQAFARIVQVLDTKEEVVIATTAADPDGRFCVLLPVGEYSIKTTVTEYEASAGLLLLPERRHVSVTSSVLSGIVFSQYLGSLSGSVQCSGVCQPMNIALHRLKDGLADREAIRTAVVVNGSSGSYFFDDVLPGPYVVAVEYPNWCWAGDTLETVVDTNKSPPLHFVQTGYLLELFTAVNTTMHYEAENITSGSLECSEGINRICFDQPGLYSLTPQSCYAFDQKEYVYNCDAPAAVTLKVSRVMVSVMVLTSESINDIVVTLTGGEDDAHQVTAVEGTGQWDEQTKSYQYHFQHYAKVSDTLEVAPSSPELIFSPTRALLTIGRACPQHVEPFHGRRGRLVQGYVNPPLMGVTITLSSEQFGTVTVLTDSNGHYSYGPILSDIKVTASASKENHYFTAKQDDQHSFTALKMSGVNVKVSDDGGKALAGVLVSLSGTSFRSNNFTDRNGALFYKDLTPGIYHLRPLLREYMFEPITQELNLSDGESIDAKFIGKQTAFSCYGRVYTLSGHAVEGVSMKVVGVGDSCVDFREETITEQDGRYRLRGLNPQCLYSVSVDVANTVDISRATPPSRQLEVVDSDTDSVDFVVFHTPSVAMVTGNVVTTPEFMSTLKVVLYRMEESIAAEYLDTAGFFELTIPLVPSKEYTVHLETTLSHRTYSYQLAQASFATDTVPQHLSFTFQATKRLEDLNSQRGSFIGIILAVVAIFTAAHYQKLYKLFTQQWSPISALVPTSTSKKTRS